MPLDTVDNYYEFLLIPCWNYQLGTALWSSMLSNCSKPKNIDAFTVHCAIAFDGVPPGYLVSPFKSLLVFI